MQGAFPVSWKTVKRRFYLLDVSGSAKLTGCVPLQNITILNLDGTSVQGMCPPDTAAELRQAQALRLLLPKVFFGVGPASSNLTAGYDEMVQAAALKISKIGSFAKNWGQSSVMDGLVEVNHKAGPLYGFVSMRINVVNGTEYVTEIKVVTERSVPMVHTMPC
jgi:hypothetical protein